MLVKLPIFNSLFAAFRLFLYRTPCPPKITSTLYELAPSKSRDSGSMDSTWLSFSIDVRNLCLN